MPNWSSAEKVIQTIRAGDDIAFVQSENRSKVIRAANCAPPLDAKLAEKIGLKINVEWGELTQKLLDARRQFLSAHTGSQYFFTVKFPDGPDDKRDDWGAFVTAKANKPLRESMAFYHLHDYRWASVSNHGIGPSEWKDPYCIVPRFAALNDLRIATDTLTDFSNLEWLAVRRSYTWFELINAAINSKKGNRWDKKAVMEILRRYKTANFTDAQNNYNMETDIEKLVGLTKQNGGYYGNDALPLIPLWHFYFHDDTGENGEKGWYMVVVPESETIRGGAPDEFLWKSDKPYAAKLEHFFHCQFGDLNNDPPFKFSETRGLGFMLLEQTYWRNITRCRMLQHIHDNFNIWLRSTDPVGKARASIQEFANMAVVHPGLTVIPQAERHQVEADLVEYGMADLKQLIQESSSGYTQQQDTGTSKEQTAFETRVKMEQTNAVLGSILQKSFKYEAQVHREIMRRFCLPRSQDLDALKFQRACRQYNIPRQFLDVDLMEIEPVTPLGMGNPTLALTMAQQLMSARGAYPAKAQMEILHQYTLVVTQDPRKAARWAPVEGAPMESDAKREAIGLFGTLMTGVPVPPMQSNFIDQIDALMPLLAGKVVQIEQRDNMADHAEASGLMNVGNYIAQCIKGLAEDPVQKARVKQYSDSLGKVMNQVKGVGQRGAEAAQKQGGNNGDDAKLAVELRNKKVKEDANARSKDAKTAQSIHHKDMAFRQNQKIKDAEAFSEIQRKNIAAKVDANNRTHSFDGED
jgi:hypothetical protein